MAFRKAIDDAFYNEAHNLSGDVDKLPDWSLIGQRESWEAFQIWKMTGWTVFPFPGGWLDQPVWVQRDFKTLLHIRAWHYEQVDKPNIEGLPSIENT